MGKLVIFSEVRGRVLLDGKPVPGATVERTFDWVAKDERGKDSTTTGPTGEFTLPAIERRSLLASLFPHETLIGQTLTVHHAGKSYLAWRFTKRDYQPNGELQGKPLRLVCRLEAAPTQHDGGFYGACDVE